MNWVFKLGSHLSSNDVCLLNILYVKCVLLIFHLAFCSLVVGAKIKNMIRFKILEENGGRTFDPVTVTQRQVSHVSCSSTHAFSGGSAGGFSTKEASIFR
ncbi:hypothetical protein L6452_12874 [Arctium lappa]|uniref:Uncharacterized protein n=1 Tax=Arctium lappa TaxID=4217 RepID=A0ACB9CGN5_ARCLA|nr:hypothetical protein L6452_12874 [Arctium lappa]